MGTPEDTRNFAIIGHAKDGKTSLGEGLLHRAGTTKSLGKVDDGSSVLDFQPEEKERKATLSCSIYSFEHDGKHLTLVDTPGDPNFQADGRIALQALDAVILAVSAVDGVKVGTEAMFRAAQRAGVPVLAFVNGMDRDRADLAAAVESLRKIDVSPAVLTFPLGAAASFAGVVDRYDMRVVEARGDVDLPEETSPLHRSAEVRAKDLNRHGSIELEVIRQIDRPHGSGANLADDSITIG